MSSLYFKTLNYLDNSKPTHLGIYFSLFFHLSILLFAIGLPDFFKPKPIFIPQVIPIEILNVSDVTSIKPIKDEIPINNKQNKNIKQKKFNSSENTEVQKVKLQEKSNENQNISDNKIQKRYEQISINDVSTADESAGSTNLVATLSTASARTITIDYATSDGTATASADYTVGTGTITFAPNVTTQNIPITVLADTVDEVDETVTVTLSNPSNVTINDGVGELTITDDDGSPERASRCSRDAGGIL